MIRAGFVFAIVWLATHAASAGTPQAPAPSEPAPAPLVMHMVLEKTIFHIDVLALDVTISDEAAQRIRTLAQGKPYSDALAEKIGQAALSSRKISFRSRFLRDVSFDRFSSGVRDNVECAFQAGFSPETEYRRVKQDFSVWFAPLVKRELKKGDVLEYDVDGDHLHTTFVSREGRKLVDIVDTGPGPRRSVMGSYLAPCSDFRELLIRSLFRKR